MKTRLTIAIGVGLAVILGVFLWRMQKRDVTQMPRISADDHTFAFVLGEGPRTAADELILSQTVPLTLHYEKIGQYWSGVLDNESQPNRRRAYAASVLGQMNYAPAVPILIKHRRFQYAASYNDLDEAWKEAVVSIALRQYGNAAVPDIVDAHFAETEIDPNGIILGAIPRKTAMTYIVGLHAQHDTRVTDAIVLEFHKNYGYIVFHIENTPSKINEEPGVSP